MGHSDSILYLGWFKPFDFKFIPLHVWFATCVVLPQPTSSDQTELGTWYSCVGQSSSKTRAAQPKTRNHYIRKCLFGQSSWLVTFIGYMMINLMRLVIIDRPLSHHLLTCSFMLLTLAAARLDKVWSVTRTNLQDGWDSRSFKHTPLACRYFRLMFRLWRIKIKTRNKKNKHNSLLAPS